MADEKEWTPEHLSALLDLETVESRMALPAALRTLHPADAAEWIHSLSDEDQRDVACRLDADTLSEILTYLNEPAREIIIPHLDEKILTEAFRQMDTDDAVQIIEAFRPEDKEQLLSALPSKERVILEESLVYPEESAGRLMQRDCVTAPEHWDVGQMIDYVRSHRNLPDDFYDVFIVDAKNRPLGVLPLSRLIRSRRSQSLSELMETQLHTIAAEEDQENVAFLFRKYGLVSAPVVNKSGHILGMITVDDVVHIIDREIEEDFLRLAGVSSSGQVYKAAWRSAFGRFQWLFVNLLTAILASLVISQFQDSISSLVALAVLMPIVASMGGNSGTQALTIIVRALAMRHIGNENRLSVVSKEIMTGLLLGTVFAVLSGVVTYLWFHNAKLGIVMAAAMLANLVAASAAGALIPLSLKKMGLDPALSSTVFLTTVTDVVGFFAFLGLASAFLV
jgi:magnesium transporter